MSQISMPMRILLIGAVVFLAAWFTILKPGGAEEELPPVQPANIATTPAPGAAATPEAGAAEAQDTTVAAAAVPADVLAKLPKDVAKALTERKTLVLGVFTDDATDWRPMADDDRYVRNALKKTNRYKGEVFAKNISVADLSRYGSLVNELGVNQSPAVVVIDRNLKGTVLTGYVDRIAINQAIADARRDSIDPYITDDYLQQANDVCERFDLLAARWSLPTVRGEKHLRAAAKRWDASYVKYLRAIDRLETPAKWKSFEANWKRALKLSRTHWAKTFDAAIEEDDAALAKLDASWDGTEVVKLDRRFNDAGLTSCAINRRS